MNFGHFADYGEIVRGRDDGDALPEECVGNGEVGVPPTPGISISNVGNPRVEFMI